jgi:hypothetical protein
MSFGAIVVVPIRKLLAPLVGRHRDASSNLKDGLEATGVEGSLLFGCRGWRRFESQASLGGAAAQRLLELC